MANINQLVRRKQNLRMALIGLGISAVGGAARYLSSAQHAGKAAQTQQQSAAAQYDRCGLTDLR